MTSLKPYPAYRASGIEWLGDIPAHWHIRRGGGLFTERNETGFPELPILEVSLVTGVQIRNFDESSRKQMMSDRSGYKKAHEGDLPYNMMRMWQGAIGVAPVDGLVSPAYVVLRPRTGTRGDFYARLFRTDAFMGEVKRNSRGIVSDRDRLYWDDFKQLHLPYPSLNEQRAIAAFLDAMEARITRFIAARKKMIRLLEEKKQAVINQAVTKGLDPTAPMKDSGIEWLGEIPAHWNTPALRHLGTKFGSGMTPRGGATTYVAEGVKLLRSQNVHFDGLRLDDVAHITEEVDEMMSGSRVLPGDVLLNITGASLGRVCAVPKDIGRANVNQHVCIIRPVGRSVLPGFLAAYLRSSPTQLLINQVSTGAAREGLTLDDMKPITVPLPPFVEQRQIAAHIEVKSSRLNHLASRHQREIELIQEYRTRLISAVVTGKLDVRGVELGELPEFERLLEEQEVVDLADDVMSDDVVEASS